jgi:hypothetical protein
MQTISTLRNLGKPPWWETSMGRGDREPDIVRARRLELVDSEGRVWAVLGELDPGRSRGGDASLYGLELQGAGAAARISISVGQDGPSILLEIAGNTAIHLGANGPASDAVDARSFAYLCDWDGTPAVGWRVADDGSVTEWPRRG